MFSIFYLSVFQLVEGNQTDSRELLDFSAFLSPTTIATGMAEHYGMEAKDKAVASVSGALQGRMDSCMDSCMNTGAIRASIIKLNTLPTDVSLAKLKGFRDSCNDTCKNKMKNSRRVSSEEQPAQQAVTASQDAAQERSLDSPADRCSSWKSIGHIAGRIPVSKGVFCQVGIKAAEGNEWKQCVDGTTEPTSGIMYTGVCPGSITDDGIAAFLAAKDRSLQDTPDAAISQCSSWKSIGLIAGRIPVSKGVFCQVGPQAAEGNEWKQCVDGTTKPKAGSVMYTGLCQESAEVGDLHI
jgi:hypothetical protein